jgi:hypothetical protein
MKYSERLARLVGTDSYPTKDSVQNEVNLNLNSLDTKILEKKREILQHTANLEQLKSAVPLVINEIVTTSNSLALAERGLTQLNELKSELFPEG